MPVASGISGATVTIQVGDGMSSEGFTTIAKVTGVSQTGSKLDSVDTTNMDSPNQYREKIGGLLDSGSVTFDLIYTTNVEATQARLLAIMESRVAGDFKIVVPNSLGTFAFSALVVQFDLDLPLDKAIMRKLKLDITGKITRT